jgi:hypothetical protein
VDREFLYRLEDQVNRARYEIDEKYHMSQELRLGKDIIQTIGEKPVANSLKAQGLPGKLAKFMHGVEFDASKLSDRIDGLETRKGAAFSRAAERLDATEANIGEVEQFVKDLEAATNGDA